MTALSLYELAFILALAVAVLAVAIPLSYILGSVVDALDDEDLAQRGEGREKPNPFMAGEPKNAPRQGRAQ